MLMTLEGSVFPASLNKGRSFCVKKKMPFTLVSMTLSQPISGYVSIGSPQATPALLIKISSLSSFALIASARASMPSTLETSAGMDMHSPPYSSLSFFAVSSQASAFLELI